MAELILLPGLGADHRLFGRIEGLDISVPEWPVARPGESLATFAERLAGSVRGPVRLLGGASFGGMVALEMAPIVRPGAVALLGSCTSRDALSPLLRTLGRLCVRLPDFVLQAAPLGLAAADPEVRPTVRAGSASLLADG